MKRCTVDQCDAKHMARGLCQKHYNAIYHATIRKGQIKNYGSVYPQAVVKVPVRGWGYLT
jgi:hypothetical protein